MKTLILAIFTGILFLTNSVYSQNFEWAKSSGPTDGSSSGMGIAVDVDAAGNVYSTGYFSGTIRFGSVNLTNSGVDANSYITKQNNSGNFLQVVKIDGMHVQVIDIACDNAGNSYITGWFKETVNFGNGISLSDPDAERKHTFTAKYDSDLNCLWAQKASNTYYLNSSTDGGIAIDKTTGDCYVAGSFRNFVSFGSHTITIPPYNSGDAFLVKYSSGGAYLWSTHGGGSSSDYGFDVNVDRTGNVYLSGRHEPDAIGINFNGNLVPSDGMSAFYVKFNSGGNFLFGKINGEDDYIDFHNIGVDNNYNVYTTTFKEIFKFNSAGNLQWRKPIQGNGNYTKLKTDIDGNSYLCGFFSGTVSFAPYTIVSSGSYRDIFVVKYNSPGNVAWAVSAGGSSTSERVNGLSADPFGNAYLTGIYGESANFGSIILNSTYFDVYIAKISENCTGDCEGNLLLNGRFHNAVYSTNGNIWPNGNSHVDPWYASHNTPQLIKSILPDCGYSGYVELYSEDVLSQRGLNIQNGRSYKISMSIRRKMGIYLNHPGKIGITFNNDVNPFPLNYNGLVIGGNAPTSPPINPPGIADFNWQTYSYPWKSPGNFNTIHISGSVESYSYLEIDNVCIKPVTVFSRRGRGFSCVPGSFICYRNMSLASTQGDLEYNISTWKNTNLNDAPTDSGFISFSLLNPDSVSLSPEDSVLTIDSTYELSNEISEALGYTGITLNQGVYRLDENGEVVVNAILTEVIRTAPKYIGLNYSLEAKYPNLDSIKVFLANSAVPFEIIDSSTVFPLLDSTKFKAYPTYENAVPGNSFYLIVKHRNSIETWSASPVIFSDTTLYDFTTSADMAFGDNMKQVGTSFAIYSGDVNQNGIIDLSDLQAVYNDGSNFANGYLNTDLTGDGIVDLSDLNIDYNNGVNFIAVLRP